MYTCTNPQYDPKTRLCLLKLQQKSCPVFGAHDTNIVRHSAAQAVGPITAPIPTYEWRSAMDVAGSVPGSLILTSKIDTRANQGNCGGASSSSRNRPLMEPSDSVSSQATFQPTASIVMASDHTPVVPWLFQSSGQVSHVSTFTWPIANLVHGGNQWLMVS